MKHFLNTLAAIVLPLITVSSVAVAANDQSLQLKTQSFKDSKGLGLSIVHDGYKYVKGTEPHDNYTYYLGIGTFDLHYWVGTSWIAHYSLFLPPIYMHKAGQAPGARFDHGDSPLEKYFNCAKASAWSDFTPSVNNYLFPKQFDKDMSGEESRDFDNVLGEKGWGCAGSNIWAQAWQNHDAVLIIYYTWYTGAFHFTMDYTYSIQIATQAVYNKYFNN